MVASPIHCLVLPKFLYSKYSVNSLHPPWAPEKPQEPARSVQCIMQGTKEEVKSDNRMLTNTFVLTTRADTNDESDGDVGLWKLL